MWKSFGKHILTKMIKMASLLPLPPLPTPSQSKAGITNQSQHFLISCILIRIPLTIFSRKPHPTDQNLETQ